MNRRASFSRQDLGDLVWGATVLGGGGGGSPVSGCLLAATVDYMANKFGKPVQVVPPEEVPDDAGVAVIFSMCSPAALLEKPCDVQFISAIDKLEEAWGRIDYLVAEETGGFNSMGPFLIGAVKGKPVIDADGCGRAVPEIQDMFEFCGLSMSPFVLADEKGNCAVLYVRDGVVGESIGRAVTTEYGMVAGCAAFPMSGRQMKETVIPGTVSLCQRIGLELRLAREENRDPIDAIMTTVNGLELIRGTITKMSGGAIKSFDYGSFEIRGFGSYEGKSITVDFKNENMIAWSSPGVPVGMVPDIITAVSLDGLPYTNSDLCPGLDIAVIGIRAHARWNEIPQGFESFRHILSHFGYEGPYLPMRSLKGCGLT